MSEFLAEARILVRPDTTKFRAELEAALSLATKPITIPVVPVVAGGINAATTATNQFTVAQTAAAAETQAVAAALEKETIAATQATAAQTAHTRSVAGVARGAGASALTLFGLRGATLAASGAFLAGTAAVVGFSKAIQSAAALETELNVFKVTAGATADEMNRVSAASKQLGRDITLPGVTASSAATAMTELAKAGLSVEDSLAGARGVLQLATAAQIDVAQSSNLVANTLNAFGLAGEDAVKVADLLAGAAKSAQGEIGEFGTALGQVASVADQFGVSAADTVTLLTQLAKSGLQGGRAGTTLRVAILGLVKPTVEAGKALAELEKRGVEITKPNGAFDPTAFAQINEALKSYSKEQQNVIRNTIFSSDAIKVLGRATSGGVADFNAINQAVSESGLAQEAAAARTQGLQGDMENLSNQVGALGLTLGQVASGPTSAFVGALADMVSDMNAAADGAVQLAGSIKNIGDRAAETDPVIGFLGDHLSEIGNVVKWVNPVTRGFALAGLAAKKFGGDVEEAGVKTDTFKGTVNSATDALKGLQAGLFGVAAIRQAPVNTGLGVNQVENVIGGFDAEEVRARISGDNAKLLEVLNTEQDFLERQLQRDFVKRRPALKRAIEQALLGTVNDIAAVQSQATSKADALKRQAEKAASDAAAAIRSREQALLSAQGLARDQRQNRIAQAAETEGLQDDVAQQKKLKALVLAQIAAVRERISVEGGRAAAVAALQAILIQVNGQLKSLAEQQQEAQREQRAALVQSASLDVDLAQITGNPAAEVRARERLIVQLKRQQALVKKGTNEWKQLRNDIAAQNAAIAQVQAEKKKGRSFAQDTFQFLQDQQGFASNLLGNLIPTGATGGLVGGGAPVQSALTPAAGFADGQAKSGPTAGQAQTTNAILLGILSQLKQLNGDNTAPEAQRQNRGQRAVMDGVGGG